MVFYATTLWEQGDRSENEDSIAVMNITIDRTPVLFAVVADGIGGLSAGEQASSMVTYSLKMAFENASRSYKCLSIRYMKHLFMRELFKCHNELDKKGMATGNRMGTTCSLLLVVGRKGLIIHIGDSRIYHIRRGELVNRLLTKDSTNGDKLVRCIGAGSYHRPQIRRFNLRKKEACILCSDGFYRRQMGEIMKLKSESLYSNQLNTASKRLSQEWLLAGYNAVRRRGESDNISAILVEAI